MKSSLDKYNLHDSLVNNIQYDNIEKKLIIDIELCNWLQSDYTEGESEMMNGTIEFTGISNYYHEPTNMSFDSDEILSIETLADTNSKDEKIKIVLRGDSDVKLITFNAKSIELKII